MTLFISEELQATQKIYGIYIFNESSWIRIGIDKPIYDFEVYININDNHYKITHYDSFGETDSSKNMIVWASLSRLYLLNKDGLNNNETISLKNDQLNNTNSIKVAVIKSGSNPSELITNLNKIYRRIEIVRIPAALR